MDADVLLQAGHQGRTRNHGSGTKPSHGATGLTVPEHLMTPVVADMAAAVLESHGVSVIRVPGVFPRTYNVQLGICCHFDGSDSPCASGASVGYPAGSPLGSNKATADRWKEIWGRHWPFAWMKDNFTPNLSGYYGYSRMRTSIAEMLIEFGEITCPEQDQWLQPRLEWIGRVVAHFAGSVVGVDIEEPPPFRVGGEVDVVPSVVSDPWDDDLAAVRVEIAELRREVIDLRQQSAQWRGEVPKLDEVEVDH